MSLQHVRRRAAPRTLKDASHRLVLHFTRTKRVVKHGHSCAGLSLSCAATMRRLPGLLARHAHRNWSLRDREGMASLPRREATLTPPPPGNELRSEWYRAAARLVGVWGSVQIRTADDGEKRKGVGCDFPARSRAVRWPAGRGAWRRWRAASAQWAARGQRRHQRGVRARGDRFPWSRRSAAWST